MKISELIFTIFFFLFVHQATQAAISADESVKTLFGAIDKNLETCKKTLGEKKLEPTTDKLCQEIPTDLVKEFSKIAQAYESQERAKLTTGEKARGDLETKLSELRKNLDDLKQEASEPAIIRVIRNNFKECFFNIQGILYDMTEALSVKLNITVDAAARTINFAPGTCIAASRKLNKDKFDSRKAQFELYIKTIIDLMTKIQENISDTKASGIITTVVARLNGQKGVIANVNTSMNPQRCCHALYGVIEEFEKLKGSWLLAEKPTKTAAESKERKSAPSGYETMKM